MNSHEHEIEILERREVHRIGREMEEGQVKSGLYIFYTHAKLSTKKFN